MYRDNLKAIITQGLARWNKSKLLNSLPNAKYFIQAANELKKSDLKFDEESFDKLKEDSKCTLAMAISDIFENISTESADFAEQVTNKMRSVVKTFDGDRYWAAALLHDRILKTAQVRIEF
jgi:gas vesicle protein